MCDRDEIKVYHFKPETIPKVKNSQYLAAKKAKSMKSGRQGDDLSFLGCKGNAGSQVAGKG